jgi:Raf kinase inhibitor-like YbhB/YbcL family protein
MPLMIASPAIPPGGPIAVEYTCDGADISPPLSWSGVPQGTGGFVLILDDPDAPSGDFYHWAAYDIPAGSRGLEAGYSTNRPGTGFREARNDFGKLGYGGPCPPKGGGVHHYHFRLLAISRPTLDLRPPTTALEVLRTAQPYVIERAEFVGTYRR